MPPAPNSVKAHLQTLMAAAEQRWTQPDLEKTLALNLNATRLQVRREIRQLVAAGELMYSNEDGHTFIVPSYRRPVRVTQRVWLSPPDCHTDPGPDEVVVRLQTGIAFGSGSHPSTRLALKAIDWIVSANPPDYRSGPGTVLDVGTGSGVLAIAALLLGFDSGIGIDVDACARSEARQNLLLNSLEDRLRIVCDALYQVKGQFDLVTANLRLPSLLRHADWLQQLTASGGAMVLSGIRTDELDEIVAAYGKFSLKPLGCWKETGWACQAFGK